MQNNTSASIHFAAVAKFIHTVCVYAIAGAVVIAQRVPTERIKT